MHDEGTFSYLFVPKGKRADIYMPHEISYDPQNPEAFDRECLAIALCTTMSCTTPLLWGDVRLHATGFQNNGELKTLAFTVSQATEQVMKYVTDLRQIDSEAYVRFTSVLPAWEGIMRERKSSNTVASRVNQQVHPASLARRIISDKVK